MQTKLTLSLDKGIIDKAKVFAKERQVSLSFLVGNYLKRLVSEYKTDATVASSIVEELSGIATLSPDLDYRKEHADYLSNKHK